MAEEASKKQKMSEESSEIVKTELEIMALVTKLNTLRKESKPTQVENYSFTDTFGKTVTLLDLFVGKDVLFVIHNMGQACRYCTLWADGLNGFISHLESKFAVVLASKDDYETQRLFANSRNWRFRTVSHKGHKYGIDNADTCPGIACYTREGANIYKKNVSRFGPGDMFCPFWSVISLAGLQDEVTPQYNYWKPPCAGDMEDGGENLP